MSDEPIGQAGGIGAMLVVALVLEVAAVARRAKARLVEWRSRCAGTSGR